MDAYMVILRLIHIFAGIFWVGTTIFFVSYLAPNVRALGPDGGKFMQGLLLNTRFDRAMPAASILTTIAGILLYARVTNNFSDTDYMSSAGGIVLSIGSLAGLLAFGHGGAVIGRIVGQQKTLAQQLASQDGPPSPEQGAELATLNAKMGQHTLITLVLMIIAVVGMSAARYF